MVEVTVLGSGSKGNSTLIRTKNTAVLVDAGFSCRQLTLRLAEVGWSLDKIDGIVISHEHTDHVCGLRVTNKKFPQTVYCNAATLASYPLQSANLNRTEIISAGEEFSIGDIGFKPFTIPHDAVDPLGFVMETGGLRVGHLTDAGFPTELCKHHLQDCHLMVLETNHDYDMLVEGPYPWPVKQRIMSRTGHLNNSAAAELLMDVYHTDLSTVFLAHLSQENNRPDLAHEACAAALAENGNGTQPKLIVTSQSMPSETVRIE